MKKRILIAGVTGFLGGALKEYIARREPGIEVLGLTRRRGGSSGLLPADLTDPVKTAALLRRVRPDYVFQFCGGDRGDPAQLFSSQFLATRGLLDAILKTGLLRIRVVIPGSAAEYGRPAAKHRLMTETDALRPESWYGFIKWMQTSLGLFYARRSGLDVVVARIFNVAGAGTPERLVAGQFAFQIARIEAGRRSPVIETNGLSSRRDFIDVADLCAGLLTVARQGRKGETYNICSGRAHSVRELLQRLLKEAGKKNIKVRERRDKGSGSFDVIGSNAKIRKELGWSPTISLAESLRQTLEDHRRRMGGGGGS